MKVKVTHEARLGHSIANFINFRNCNPDHRGVCNVTTDWELIGPDGKRRLAARTKVRVGLPALRPGTLGLSTESADFTFEAPDRGRYVIRARTTDHVAGITLTTQDAITVRP